MMVSRLELLGLFHPVFVTVGLILWRWNRRASPDGRTSTYFAQWLGKVWSVSAGLILCGWAVSGRYAGEMIPTSVWAVHAVLFFVVAPLGAAFHVWRERYRRPLRLNLNCADNDSH